VKLYTHARSLSPRRLALCLAEKKLTIPTVEVDIGASAHRAPEFLAKNPLGRVPLLELDGGRTLSESDAIIEYLEELHPEPPLLGRDAWQRALTRQAERVIDRRLPRGAAVRRG
jgi:glutathione S-transferase